MIVLKIIGWVLLGLIALVIGALCIKVVVSAEYSEEKTEVFVKWLFLKIPLYPAKKKESPPSDGESSAPSDGEPPDGANGDANAETNANALPENVEAADANAEAETAQTEETPQTAEKKKSDVNLLKLIYEAEGIDGLIEIVKRVFSYLGTFFGGLLRAVIVEDLKLEIRCAKKDAAKTAIYYGEVCSALFPMLGALASGCTLKKYDINIYPDYLARYGEASFAVRLHVVPIRLVGITLALVFKLLFKVLIGLLVKIFKVSKNGTPSTPKGKNGTPSAVPNGDGTSTSVEGEQRESTDNLQKNNNNIRKSEVTNE